jgi:membrane protein DedA with SNARE-associated domain
VDSFIEFVREWGYVAVFLGAIVEGESVILTACALAALGYLDIYKVAAVTFFTTLFVDQGLFYLGRAYGPAFFDKFPSLKQRANRAFALLHRFDKWFILSFRFIYGIRTISPVVIGAAMVAPSRYSPLNLLSAIIWTSISCYSGYMMGDLLETIMQNFATAKTYIIYAIAAIVVIGVTIYCIRKHRLKTKANSF